MDLREFSDRYGAIEAETRRAFLGQEEVLSSVLVAIFARGHVLIEGVPGVGKTLLRREGKRRSIAAACTGKRRVGAGG